MGPSAALRAGGEGWSQEQGLQEQSAQAGGRRWPLAFTWGPGVPSVCPSVHLPGHVLHVRGGARGSDRSSQQPRPLLVPPGCPRLQCSPSKWAEKSNRCSLAAPGICSQQLSQRSPGTAPASGPGELGADPGGRSQGQIPGADPRSGWQHGVRGLCLQPVQVGNLCPRAESSLRHGGHPRGPLVAAKRQ